MNAKTSPALPIFLIVLLLTALLVIMVLAIEPTLAAPLRQAGDPLPPAVEPYAIGFDDADELTENWMVNSGVWISDTEQSPVEYVQQDATLTSANSLYRRGIEIEHGYSATVTLRHLDGNVGGLIFNAPNAEGSVSAEVLRYNHAEGAVEWGWFNNEGDFTLKDRQTEGIPSDSEFHTLTVVVAGDEFIPYFDEVQVHAGYTFTHAALAHVGVYTAEGSFAFRSMSVKVTEASTPTPIPTATLLGELSPSDQTYTIGFDDPAILDAWLPVQGTWEYNQGYVQSDVSNANAFSYYDGRVKGDYIYTTTLSYLGGSMGGGVLFNAPNNNSLAGAMLVAFNPDSASGSGAIIHWGYFDSNSNFIFLGDHLVVPPAIDGVERRLRVQVASGNYSIWLDENTFLENEPFVPTIQVANPYIGLYTAYSTVRFGETKVAVGSYLQPTATPEPTPTISPTPTSSPPPTATATPDPDHLTPNETPYVIGFGTDRQELGSWLAHRGNWAEEPTGLKQRDILAEHAINYYAHTIAGDYEYEVTFGYLTPLPTATAQSEKDGGIIFNSPATVFNGAFVVTFEGNDDPAEQFQDIRWGYFEKDGTDPNFVQIGRVTGQIAVTDEISRTLRVVVSDDYYSIWSDDQQIVNRFQFPSDIQRIAEPSIGVYANKTIMKFTEGEVKVNDYTGVDPTPTHVPPTPTPSLTVVVTPKPTRTDTPTPTWTPGTPTATATQAVPSVQPTLTNTPIIINQPPAPTPLPPIVISTPTIKPATQTAIAAAVIAATATDSAATATAIFDQGATATTAALSVTQTASIIPTSPMQSPTPTPLANVGATNTVQANATIVAAQTMTVMADATMTAVAATTSSALTAVTGTPAAVAQVALPAQVATETAAAQTAVAQSVFTTTIIAGQPVVIVIATPTPTQRPIEEPPQTPTEPTAPVKVAFWARIMNAIVTSAAIIWLGVGLAVFIGIAAVLAGIAFQPEEESPYELHDDISEATVTGAMAGEEVLDEAEIDRILDNLEEEIAVARAADTTVMDDAPDRDQQGGEDDGEESRRDRNQGDNWPTSLP